MLPSLVTLFLALPYLGLGFWPSLVALTVLACPPVLVNTYAGLRNVDAATREAALGIGMSPWQALLRVELPLAYPVIMTGVRIAAVEVIASATLAAFIAGGGLGEYVTARLCAQRHKDHAGRRDCRSPAGTGLRGALRHAATRAAAAGVHGGIDRGLSG
ncbi:MAG: ABC transporter permease [Tetrasphaera sp.]